MEIDKQNWIEWLKLKGLSEKSVQDYCGYFDKLDKDKLGPAYLLKWLRDYNNGVARAMLKNLLTFIKSSPEFPQETKVWVREFEIPQKTGARKERVIITISKEQVHSLAKAMPHPRERFMVLTTFYLGLRSEELLNLKIDDFDWENGMVRIIGKRNKERILPLIPQLKDRLIEYINSEIEKNPNFEVLFGVSSRYWRHILTKWSKRTIGKQISPHGLRHSCGTFLHEQGLDLKEIADFLGHSSVNTAQIYVHLDKRNLNNKVIEALS